MIRKLIEFSAHNRLLVIGLVAAAQNSFTQARQLNPRCEAADVALHGLRQTCLLARGWGKLRGLWQR